MRLKNMALQTLVFVMVLMVNNTDWSLEKNKFFHFSFIFLVA